MPFFVKPLVFTTAALLLSAAAPSLRAQSADGDLSFADATASDITTFNGTATTLPVGSLENTTPLTLGTIPHVRRTYSGTATQTTAAGAVTTGTFTLQVESDGTLFATFVFGGVNSTYNGAVARTSLGEKRVNGSGYLQKENLSTFNVTNHDGTTSPVTHALPNPKAAKVSVTLDQASTTGGILNADGSTLLFRGDRVAKSTGN